jgi:hypothetical protein
VTFLTIASTDPNRIHYGSEREQIVTALMLLTLDLRFLAKISWGTDHLD